MRPTFNDHLSDTGGFKRNSITPLGEGLEDKEQTSLQVDAAGISPEEVAGPLFRSDLSLLYMEMCGF